MKIRKSILSLSLIMTLSFLVTGCAAKPEAEAVELNISAAASLTEAMADLEAEFKTTNPNITLVTNFGASGSLQQQIEQGAPCDIFISAGIKQMTTLDEKGLLLESTNKDLVKNELVLVGPKDTTITEISDLTTDKVKKIAVGEASSVPAGKYADEVLTKLNIKTAIQDKLVSAKDVKEVLAWATSGNADVGFVYLSDTINNDSIKIIEQISSDLHSPITYPVGIIKSSTKADSAQAFEDFLFTDKAQEILNKYGYSSVN
ncbi:molybdate ABC transporter substrate-binding protein [Clostridium vincentii]|uniref:Molybdate-binding periplasmic protein n=1 Tax=Clostridium vincentii TaxID=52704 RepID=A0A2T0BL63_9CLOT|nr:molybdate ABC transporter substrate-binding protein [Clostridium vincentii]PRR84626.1 Molybdate-binding periplasmic protein precursor [Clostridium vincentii]